MDGAHATWLLGPFSVWHWIATTAILGMLMRPPWNRR
jgi:hypothetical protein